MLIDSHHPSVRALVTEWVGTQSASEEDRFRVSMALKEQLADQILGCIASFGGELLLMQHRFLTMLPSGAHSFAYGSEMMSKTVYWTHVARILAPPTVLKEHSSGSEIGCDGVNIWFASSTIYYIPVAWQWALYPFYPNGGNQPSFGFTKPGRRLDWIWMRTSKPEVPSVPSSDPLNISGFGDNLFRLRKGQYDWATKTCLAVGTEAVGLWLAEHRSQESFKRLVDY